MTGVIAVIANGRNTTGRECALQESDTLTGTLATAWVSACFRKGDLLEFEPNVIRCETFTY